MGTAVQGARACPKCGGPTWDNRGKKATGEFKASAPDYKCRTTGCDGVIWPEKPGTMAHAQQAVAAQPAPQQTAAAPGSTIETEYLSLVERVGARLLALQVANRGWPPVLMSDIQACAATITIQQTKRA
jgi:hypothetical protein